MSEEDQEPTLEEINTAISSIGHQIMEEFLKSGSIPVAVIFVNENSNNSLIHSILPPEHIKEVLQDILNEQDTTWGEMAPSNTD